MRRTIRKSVASETSVGVITGRSANKEFRRVCTDAGTGLFGGSPGVFFYPPVSWTTRVSFSFSFLFLAVAYSWLSS